LTAEPEVTTHTLQEGDEFLLLGCDGLWDVFPSQRAVEFARARSVVQRGLGQAVAG
jgi:serine/threonine protein phosphatase PrpC